MTGDERQRNTIAWLFPITQDYIIQLVDEEWTYFYLLLILIKKDKWCRRKHPIVLESQYGKPVTFWFKWDTSELTFT